MNYSTPSAPSSLARQPKFAVGQKIRGRFVGLFLVRKVHYNESVGEHVYTVVEVASDGRTGKCPMRFVESCFDESQAGAAT
jgi:hypothetical protein